MRNDKKGKGGLRRIYNAFFYSLSGLKSAWIDESAFRQVVLLSVLGICIAPFLSTSWVECVLLVLSCVLMIICELINSAIENAVDFTSLELHPFAKKAKDMGSAIQLCSIVFFLFVWGSFLFCRVWGS
ncbi:diacylglycerol kinase [Helicobacter enhydrae]|uniref:diacylglycerol kinase n=1 Tax=Helicobacter enhydrae TaxID=222136 RepID=UPI000A6C4DFE